MDQEPHAVGIVWIGRDASSAIREVDCVRSSLERLKMDAVTGNLLDPPILAGEPDGNTILQSKLIDCGNLAQPLCPMI